MKIHSLKRARLDAQTSPKIPQHFWRDSSRAIRKQIGSKFVLPLLPLSLTTPDRLFRACSPFARKEALQTFTSLVNKSDQTQRYIDIESVDITSYQEAMHKQVSKCIYV